MYPQVRVQISQVHPGHWWAPDVVVTSCVLHQYGNVEDLPPPAPRQSRENKWRENHVRRSSLLNLEGWTVYFVETSFKEGAVGGKGPEKARG